MFSLLGFLVKWTAITLAILTAGALIQWDGRSISSRLERSLIKAEISAPDFRDKSKKILDTLTQEFSSTTRKVTKEVKDKAKEEILPLDQKRLGELLEQWDSKSEPKESKN